MPYTFPFDQRAKDQLDANNNPIPDVVSSVSISGGKLRVEVARRSGLESGSGQRGDLLGVFNGTAGYAQDKDTDSCQFAVEWLNQANQVVGQYTNAKPQGKRTIAAGWTTGGYTRQTPIGLGQRSIYNNSASAPAGALKVNIVLVYTDILNGPDTDTPTVNTNGRGDCPAIIASWSGSLTNGVWWFTKNPQDVNIITPIPGGWPTAGQIVGGPFVGGWIVGIQKCSLARTGYTLKPRGPKYGNCNNAMDTGFDIVK